MLNLFCLRARRVLCSLLRAWPLLLLLLTAGPLAAQLPRIGPLGSDPARARYAPTAAQRAQQRTSALALPFFDDFTRPLEGMPSPLRWRPTGGALVSNRLALLPPTRGAATLDGLKANGQPYSATDNSPNGPIDSLQSQPINLGSLGSGNQVYLSFAWQAGSVVDQPGAGTPSNPVRLELFVKTNTGQWESKWFYNAVRQRTPFRQVVIDLNQTKYLHGDFQFMFVASGNTNNDDDSFSVDYVLLDQGRSRGLTDTTHTDVAIGAGYRSRRTGGLGSPLRRYTAMPVWQFNAAPTTELSPDLGVNLTNLSGTATPLSVDEQGTVRDLNAGPVPGFWLQSQGLVPGNTRQFPVSGSAAAAPLPATAAAKRLRYTLALNSRETTPRTLPNDTTFRDVDLSNYFAYDDGSAEAYTFLLPYPNGQQTAFAYRVDLNQPDYVRGLRLYPQFPTFDISTHTFDYGSRTVTISVWNNNAGLPAATAIASKTAVIPAQANIPAGWDYIQIDFDQPVPVTGTFFVGFSQPATSKFYRYGLDMNSRIPNRHLVERNNAAVWDTASFPGSALMMRPVMTNNVATASTPATDAAVFTLYPNPAHDLVQVAGPAFARAAVLDAVGRLVWEQPAAQAGSPVLPLPTLPPGVYLVRLTLPDGRALTQRLLLE